MDSEAYWEKRAQERENAWHKKSQDTIEKELARYYHVSLKQMQKDMEALYGRFAQDNELSMTEARKLLKGSEFRQWRMSIDAYVKEIRKTGDKGLERELNTLAMRSRISRLDKLYGETLQELDKLGRKVSARARSFLTDAYKDNYYRGLYDIARTGHLQNAVSQVDSKTLADVLRTPWSGKNYSGTIWKNQRLLASTLKREMTTALHRGESVEKISQRIAKKMDVGISNARRLVRTELNYVQNQAAFASIEDAGMKYFQFIATLDRRTSAVCRSHDRKVYRMDEAAVGSNMPPLHPNCRSTIAGSLRGPDSGTVKTGTRAARNEAGKTIYVPAEMNYDDWKAVYVDKSKTITEWGREKGLHTGRTATASGIIKDKIVQGAVAVYYVGKIDKKIYEVVTPDIRTDEVIITDRQIQHIKERHPNDYERFSSYFAETVAKPDYIIAANKPNTAVILKEIEVDGVKVKIILRLQTPVDPEDFKNSIVTFMKIDTKEWDRLLRNKKILYKKSSDR